jgi:hypothetical protein
MPEEKWTVIANVVEAGGGREGYTWEKMKTVKGTKNKSYAEEDFPATGTIYMVEAESEEEAAEAVQKAYGQGQVTGKFLVAKSSNLKEVAPQ